MPTSSEPFWPLPNVPPGLLAEKIRSKLAQRIRENRIDGYQPYLKQLEFHAAGLKSRERLFRAGNQQGKTMSGGAEAAYHATGEYPEWWQGARIDQPNSGWVGAPSGELVRDGAQAILLGPPGEWGTGMIPKRALANITRAQGVRDSVDTVVVNHINGGLSRIKFKSYDQGRGRWQTSTLNWVWFDEEPPEDIYLEGLSRTNATDGFVWMTFTPLLGVSTVVMRFLKEKSKDRADIVMTIEDALHISEESRERIIASYPEHEREARTRGVP